MQVVFPGGDETRRYRYAPAFWSYQQIAAIKTIDGDLDEALPLKA